MAKLENVYITFKGESCYTHEDIDDMYICGMCTSSEAKKAHDELDNHIKRGEKHGKTKNNNRRRNIHTRERHISSTN